MKAAVRVYKEAPPKPIKQPPMITVYVKTVRAKTKKQPPMITVYIKERA
jgi:hypothetical protein